MKSSRVIGGVLAALLLQAAGVVSAQSLGDLAKQEAERRKTVKAPGKVYTNEKLRPEPGSAASAAGQAADGKVPDAVPAATPEPAPTAGPVKPDVTKTEAYWKKRITAARDSLSRSQTFAEALQSRINVLSTDFVNRDDPAQRNVIAADRQKAMDELARVKGEIAQYQKAITDIQDEARKANVPAGWAR